MIGQIVGNYKIEEKLGEGGMGAVYKGVDTMLDREVAIKVLRPELTSQTSVVERFRSEAVTLAKLNHPNIATLFSLFRHGEELFMVLEYVRGETLDNILQRRGALPSEEAIPVFSQVLDGINHAHELGIVHRDIKPANMMLTEKGTLKVLDFGIARLLGSARMTRAGNIIGTLEYMAPEQVKGAETDGRSDIYALGMMLYEVLTGRLPFQTENEFELMKLQTEEMPPAPREINPAIPEEVEEAIMRAIQKNPDDRFQTAGEFRELLLEAGFGTQGKMHGITGTHKRPSTHPSRPPISQAGVANSEVPTQAFVPPAVKETRLDAPAAPPAEQKEIKSTRLGASVATGAGAASTGAMKATRLGQNNQAFTPPPVNTPKAATGSFLSKLKPIHYIGAAVVVLFLLGAVIAVPLILLGVSKARAVETKAVEEQKPEESQRPAIVEMPKQAPPQTQSSVAPPAQTASPDVPTLNSQQPLDLKPLENEKPVVSKPAEKPVEKPITVQKPAVPKPTAPKKPAAKKKSLEEMMTDDG